MAATIPYIGSKISLISNSEIRYEGILYTINTQESTIALQSVKSFGTEGRKLPEVQPSNEVYDFIIFRGKDIKDLTVLEGTQDKGQASRGGVLSDPAIVQVGDKGEKGKGGKNAQGAGKGQDMKKSAGSWNGQQSQWGSNFGGVSPGMSGGAWGGPGGGGGNQNWGQMPHSSPGWAPQSGASWGAPMGGNDWGYWGPGPHGGWGAGSSYAKGKGGKGPQHYQPQSYNHKGGAKGKGSNFSAGGKGKGNRSGHNNHNQFGHPIGEMVANPNAVTKKQVETEYNFEQKNNEFDKAKDAGEKEVLSGYDKGKSFFDSISCEASERAKGTDRVDMKKIRDNDRSTFGDTVTMYRFAGRGRGHKGGRRGNNQRGANNQNYRPN